MQIGSIILQHSDELIEAGGELIKALGDGLIKSLPVIEENLPELIDGMVTAFLTYHDVMMEVGFELLTAIIENMPEIQQICTEATMILIQSIAEYIMSGESTSTMMESGLTLFGAIIDSIAQILGDIIMAVEPIVTGIVSKLREAVGKVLTVAGEIMNSFISGIVSFMGNVISTATEIVTNIVTYLMQAPSRVLAIGASIISSLVSGMASMIGSVTSTVGNIVNGIISRLQSLPAQMISAGVQAIQGLIQGFSSGLDGLMGLVQNTASRMASTLKSALKIHSPSKVFEEIGQFTAEGLGVGWEDEFANVKKSMENDLEFSSNVTTSVNSTSGKTTQPSNDTFVIPIYLNNKVIEDVVIDAQTLYNYRSGGR
jgi:phage-related protein